MLLLHTPSSLHFHHHRPFPLGKPPFSPQLPSKIHRKITLPTIFYSKTAILTDELELKTLTKPPILSSQSAVLAAPNANLRFRSSPELGLFAILFVLSAALGAVFSLAIVSIPAANALRKLAASMDKLAKVVSEEVPGTMSSLKLSGLEINDLTAQLSSIRQKITGKRQAKNERKKPKFNEEEFLS